MASRIVPHPEAFSIGGRGQRRPRVKDGSHLAFIRRLPCLGCGRRLGVEAAHIRMRAPEFAKPETGGGRRSDDRWSLPLCAAHHYLQHATGNERVFWQEMGLPDPLLMALVLWGVTGDIEMAEAVIEIWVGSGRRN